MRTSTRNGLRVKAGIKAGGFNTSNHNSAKLRVQSGIRAGGFNTSNHNRSGLRVRAGIRAGHTIQFANHNRRLLAA